MTVSTIPTSNNLFKTGWIILLLSAALMAVGHFFMIFILDEPVLFTDFTAFNFFAFLVILLPFRRGEKWAWAATWILPIVYAVTAVNDPEIAVYFYAFAALCVAGLLLTMGDFFAKRG